MNYNSWQRDIPAGWAVVPLRAVADYEVSNVDKVPKDGERPVRLCNYVDVYHNEFITLALHFMEATATAAEIAKFRLRKDDVIITKDSESWDDIGIPAHVRETADDLVCGYHLAQIRPRPGKLEGSFLLRCLQAKPVRLHLELAANGVTRFGLPKGAIGSTPLPLPPPHLQRAIAAYLDAETGRIDALIAAKENLLAILTEKRRAAITTAVTRGLDPNAPMRDSGIQWLGEIPAHWATERSRWLLRERDERSETGTEELLTVSHLTGVTPRSEKDVNMFEAESTVGYKVCHQDDLAINTLWAWMGAMGVAPCHGIISPAYHVYRIGPRLLPAYVDALVRIGVFAQEVTRYSKGVWSSRLRLYPEGLFEVVFPVPPIEEQAQIVEGIRQEISHIDALSAAISRSVALARERREAVIAAAITGQLEVGEPT